MEDNFNLDLNNNKLNNNKEKLDLVKQKLIKVKEMILKKKNKKQLIIILILNHMQLIMIYLKQNIKIKDFKLLI